MKHWFGNTATTRKRIFFMREQKESTGEAQNLRKSERLKSKRKRNTEEKQRKKIPRKIYESIEASRQRQSLNMFAPQQNSQDFPTSFNLDTPQSEYDKLKQQRTPVQPPRRITGVTGFSIEMSVATETVTSEEFSFMQQQLKRLSHHMAKMTEYELLFPKDMEEKKLIDLEKERTSKLQQLHSISQTRENTTPATTIFYTFPSYDFLQFSSLWNAANSFFHTLSVFDDYFPNPDLQPDDLSTSETGLFVSGIKYKSLTAQNLEQAAFVAEQKVREVFGVFKLILEAKCKNKWEAVQMIQRSGLYPAQRILVWVNEFISLGGKFTRY
eukprot:snap_masked-scaffold_35-processed-gene-2.51-mRNA-1 protein AED:1.00 eAED:1.00 QI:0/-1/0/0/-1/1/1/0/325